MSIIQYPPCRHRSLLPPRRRHLHLCHIQIPEIALFPYPIANIQSPILNRPSPIAFMVPPHDVTSCLLCPLPTRAPMTPASWGVRRMLFGHSSHSRWLSCSRRGFAEYPPPLHFTPYTLHLYTLRPTQAFPPSVMCTAVARRVSRVSVSIRVHPWAVYLRYQLCFASGLAIFSPLSFHSYWLSCSRGFPREYPHLYTLHPTLYAFNRYSHLLSCF